MKVQKNYKMPQWALTRIEAIAAAYEITYTEALLRCLDQGSKWHRKHIQREVNPAFDWEPKKPGVVIEYYNPEEEAYNKRMQEIAQAKWVDTED